MSKHKIQDVLPHQAPMILLDSLVSYTKTHCVCEVEITTQSVFFAHEKNAVPSYVGCEYMAQTIAAFAGANALDNAGKISIGFLLGSRKYKTNKAYFSLGSCLNIICEELYQEDSGLRVFKCKIVDAKKPAEVYATANINVFQPANPEEFLKQYV